MNGGNPEEAIKRAEELKFMPGNDLDLQMMMTNPVYGDREITPEFRKRLMKIRYRTIPKGTPIELADGSKVVTEKDLTIPEETNVWDTLGMFTRDMRLGNLSNQEMIYVQHFTDLAHDLINENMAEVFSISYSRGATVNELSQGKGGFLRKRFGTFTREEFRTESAPPKKSGLLFWKKRGEGQ